MTIFARQPLSSFQGWQRRVRISIAFQLGCSSRFVAEFREDVRIAIPAIVESMKDSGPDVRKAIIKEVSGLAAQGMC